MERVLLKAIPTDGLDGFGTCPFDLNQPLVGINLLFQFSSLLTSKIRYYKSSMNLDDVKGETTISIALSVLLVNQSAVFSFCWPVSKEKDQRDQIVVPPPAPVVSFSMLFICICKASRSSCAASLFRLIALAASWSKFGWFGAWRQHH